MNEGLSELLRRAKDDEALRAALASAVTDDDVVRIAGDWGVDLAVEDMRPSGELADEELESVSGGTNAAWYWATAPEFCGTAGRLCTFYAPYCTAP